MLEGIRKLGWYLFFYPNVNVLSPLEKIIIDCKKLKKSNAHSELELEIISNPKKVSNKLIHTCKNKISIDNFFPSEILRLLKQFQIENQLVIKPADKNAGICIMKKSDYDEEIFRQLNDSSCYFTSTQSHFHYARIKLTDEIKFLKNNSLPIFN